MSGRSIERSGLVERLAGGPRRIEPVARRAALGESAVTAAAPATSAATARWTAREVVAHLALVERLVFQARLEQLAAGESPIWTWTEPGTSSVAEVPTLEAAIREFVTARSETVARVEALDDVGWSRAGTHATYGRLDVAGLLGVVVDHDEHHRRDLEAGTT